MTQLTQNNSSLVLEKDATRAAFAGRLADYSILTKPRITLMVVITAYIGYALGAATIAPGAWSWVGLIGALVGTALSCMGASVFNQVYEHDTDGLMDRTRQRPLPAGRLTISEALAVGIIVSLLGVGILWVTGGWLAAAISAFTIFSYAVIYTPMKRRSSLALWVGAVPGALPPVIGYAAATGRMGFESWLVFAIIFIWQIPHFLAIAWLYREDYGRAGLKMLPVLHPDGASTFRQILAGCLALLPIGLLPTLLNISGIAYFAIALVCGLGFLWFALALVFNPTRTRARRLFFASLIYLPLVLAAMLVA